MSKNFLFPIEKSRRKEEEKRKKEKKDLSDETQKLNTCI